MMDTIPCSCLPSDETSRALFNATDVILRVFHVIVSSAILLSSTYPASTSSCGSARSWSPPRPGQPCLRQERVLDASPGKPHLRGKGGKWGGRGNTVSQDCAWALARVRGEARATKGARCGRRAGTSGEEARERERRNFESSTFSFVSRLFPAFPLALPSVSWVPPLFLAARLLTCIGLGAVGSGAAALGRQGNP